MIHYLILNGLYGNWASNTKNSIPLLRDIYGTNTVNDWIGYFNQRLARKERVQIPEREGLGTFCWRWP